MTRGIQRGESGTAQEWIREVVIAFSNPRLHWSIQRIFLQVHSSIHCIYLHLFLWPLPSVSICLYKPLCSCTKCFFFSCVCVRVCARVCVWCSIIDKKNSLDKFLFFKSTKGQLLSGFKRSTDLSFISEGNLMGGCTSHSLVLNLFHHYPHFNFYLGWTAPDVKQIKH